MFVCSVEESNETKCTITTVLFCGRQEEKLSLHFLFALKVGHHYHTGENVERGIKFLGGRGGSQQGLRWTLSRIYYKGTTDFSLRCFNLHDRLKNQETIKSNFGGIQHSQKTFMHILCISWTQAGMDFLEACLPACLEAEEQE